MKNIFNLLKPKSKVMARKEKLSKEDVAKMKAAKNDSRELEKENRKKLMDIIRETNASLQVMKGALNDPELCAEILDGDFIDAIQEICLSLQSVKETCNERRKAKKQNNL